MAANSSSRTTQRSVSTRVLAQITIEDGIFLAREVIVGTEYQSEAD